MAQQMCWQVISDEHSAPKGYLRSEARPCQYFGLDYVAQPGPIVLSDVWFPQVDPQLLDSVSLPTDSSWEEHRVHAATRPQT